MSLPEPTSERFKPLRGGLMNLYLYEDLQLLYEDGRLLLRGNNGTGKSRILALQLPFLLEGEISPSRVEPDGDQSKRIEWHLLMDGRYADRVGYTWIELGRLEDGEPRYVTLGCGMKAVQGRGAPDRWFFVTERRVGVDLSLRSASDVPLHRRALEAALGEGGKLFERAADYRLEVDRVLFGLGKARYEALLDLLVQLRRPQLARKLDEKLLSDALSSALPPLSEQVLGDVAEAFRALETDRRALRNERRVLESTSAFMVDYRRYVQTATRRVAADLRTAHSRYEHTMRDLRTAEREGDDAKAEHAEVDGRLNEARTERAGAEERVRVLEADPAHGDARRLDDARERAERAEGERARAHGEHERAVTAAADARTRRERAERACDERVEAAGRADRTLSERGAAVGLERLAEGSADAARERIAERLRHAEHLRERAAQRDAAQRKATQLTERAERARLEVQRAEERVAAGASARDEAWAELEGALEAWLAGLEVLDAPDAALVEQLAQWAERAEGAGPIEEAVRSSHARATKALAAEEARLVAESERVRAERDRLRAEHRALEDGVSAPPPAPTWRSERDARPGAPLWALCDFRGEVSHAARARVEAALEAAGLLDAWVSPDGAVGSEARSDSYLVPGQVELERSLARWLKPSIDPADAAASAVAPDTVARILASIAVDATGPAWITEDGRFGLGPLIGRSTKAEAEHIGHAAREQARRRRLDELAAELDALDAELDALAQAAASHAARAERAEEERRAAPSERPLRDATQALSYAEADARERRDDQREAEAEASAARARADLAAERLADEATQLGLATWVERLAELRQAIRDAGHALDVAAAERERAAEAQRRLDEHRCSARDAVEVAERREAQLRDRTEEARRATEVHRTLKESVGAKVEEIRRRLEAARRARAELAARVEGLVERRTTAATRVAVAAQRAADLGEQLDEREERRGEQIGRLHELARTGVWANLDAQWRGLDVPDEWSATAAVEVARRLERDLGDVPHDRDAWQRANSSVSQRVQELTSALLARDLNPRTEQGPDVLVVTIPLHGRELDPAALVEELQGEIASRQRVLDERERAILEQHLITEVASQLHECLRRGEALVQDMNREIEQRPLSTGMRLRFRWRVEDEAGLSEVRRRLLASEGVWSPDDRDAIGAFLHQRIQDERARSETGSWRDHLAAALDYRNWHRFEIERYQGGQWKRLTRRTYGTGSGGEKAVALTLPQLAAAAAHYRSAAAHAPRIILMDEAFAGVDGDMRAKCMGLLLAFDLDFVMTSEREWGCYETLPALAIYQLVTRPGLNAVHETRWVWNGRKLDRGEDPGPAHGAVA